MVAYKTAAGGYEGALATLCPEGAPGSRDAGTQSSRRLRLVEEGFYCPLRAQGILWGFFIFYIWPKAIYVYRSLLLRLSPGQLLLRQGYIWPTAIYVEMDILSIKGPGQNLLI